MIKDEVRFFDKQAEIIVKAVLPFTNRTPEKERIGRLKIQDKLESQKDMGQKEEVDEEDFMEIELRRAVKTVEVMGCIIKNRAGSLEKAKLEEMFVEAMNVYLRILSYFFEIIKNEDEQKAIIDFISERLRKINEKKKGGLSDKYLQKKARIIFWNFNFVFVYAIIYKVVHSLGSDKLTAIVQKVCDEVNTPTSFLVKHGMLMWYNKNLQIDELKKNINEKDFSKMAERTIELMVADYVALHNVNYRDIQRIESKLGILRSRRFRGVPKKMLKEY